MRVKDFPSYFPTYSQFDMPERIGLLRSRLYMPQDYIVRGTMRVVESWKELMGDPPRPHVVGL